MVTLKDIRNLDGDRLLGTLGLRRAGSNNWATPTVAGLAVGMLVGTALGFLFAPLSGEEFRSTLSRRLAEPGAKLRVSIHGNAESAGSSQRTPA